VPLPPYPTVPAPSSWTYGAPVLTSQLRNDAGNAITFLANKPGFMGWCTAGPSIAANTPTAFGLDTEQYDNWGGHSPLGSEPAWYYCQAPGWYLCEGLAGWAYTSSTQATFQAGIGTGISGASASVSWGEILPSGSTRDPAPSVVDLIQLNNVGLPAASPVTADYVELYGRQGASGNVSAATSSGLYPRLAVRWVAATSGTVSLPVPSNPSWPVPPSYVTSAILDANIRDTIRFLTYPPVFRGYAAGTQTLTSNAGGGFPAGTVMALANTTVDNYSGWRGSGNYWAAPVAGCYYVYGQVTLAAFPATGSLATGLSVNGGTVTWGASGRSLSNSGGMCVSILKRLRLNQGDEVQLMAQQSTGSTLTAESGTRLIAVWETS
jgi:hypothetical protein